MLQADQLMEKAQHSDFNRWLLNQALNHMIPFNKPHGFKVLEISKNAVKTSIPYKKRNFNHIKGLHATALATLSEFTTGLLLLNNLGTKRYRLILQRLDIEYFYQGKMAAEANFSLTQEWIKNTIIDPLESQESVIAPCPIEVVDLDGNRLTLATIYWQLKPWGKVRTKL